jgi:toxin ParE1/3/4
VKRRQVVFTPEARIDLFEIYDWIAAKAGFQTAISYIERIETYCLGFELASERGHRRDDISPGLRIVGFVFWGTFFAGFMVFSPVFWLIYFFYICR